VVFYATYPDPDSPPHADIIPAEQLLAASCPGEGPRPLPTPHGPAGRRYWPAADIVARLGPEDAEP
jgi:hypothetical protein